MLRRAAGKPGARTEFVVRAETREDHGCLTGTTRGVVGVCRLLVDADLTEGSFRR